MVNRAIIAILIAAGIAVTYALLITAAYAYMYKLRDRNREEQTRANDSSNNTK